MQLKDLAESVGLPLYEQLGKRLRDERELPEPNQPLQQTPAKRRLFVDNQSLSGRCC